MNKQLAQILDDPQSWKTMNENRPTSPPNTILHYQCTNKGVRRLLVSMLKSRSIPMLSPDDTRTDIVEATTLFPHFWLSETEGGFATNVATCARGVRGIKKESSTDEILQRIEAWQPSARVVAADLDFIVYANGNVRIGSTFVSDVEFQEVIATRSRLVTKAKKAMKRLASSQ